MTYSIQITSNLVHRHQLYPLLIAYRVSYDKCWCYPSSTLPSHPEPSPTDHATKNKLKLQRSQQITSQGQGNMAKKYFSTKLRMYRNNIITVSSKNQCHSNVDVRCWLWILNFVEKDFEFLFLTRTMILKYWWWDSLICSALKFSLLFLLLWYFLILEFQTPSDCCGSHQ